MKKICLLLCALLVLATMAGCQKTVVQQEAKIVSSVEDLTKEEQAIAEVIMAYDQAYFNWDTEAASKCVTPDYPLEDTETMLRNALGVYVDQGDLVLEDIDKFLEVEKKYYQMGSEQLQYRGWQITISGDSATALVTYGYPNADANMPSYGEELIAYRNELFMSVCGMDEATAKATLSPEEFSAAYVQVTDLDYAKRSENVTYIESVTELRLKNIDGKWYIAELVLPEE